MRLASLPAACTRRKSLPRIKALEARKLGLALGINLATVELPPLVLVAKDFISVVDLGKTVFGPGIVRILVRMKFLGQLPEGRLDFLFVGTPSTEYGSRIRAPFAFVLFGSASTVPLIGNRMQDYSPAGKRPDIVEYNMGVWYRAFHMNCCNMDGRSVGSISPVGTRTAPRNRISIHRFRPCTAICP